VVCRASKTRQTPGAFAPGVFFDPKKGTRKMNAIEFKTRRKMLNFTQEKLARFLKISVRQIERYENNFSKIPGPVGILMMVATTRKIPTLKV
jgi:DNA-binding XRE family transcriptional regulator